MICAPGSQPTAANTQCELCGNGYYKGATDALCVACPDDKPTTLVDGAASLDDCKSKLFIFVFSPPEPKTHKYASGLLSICRLSVHQFQKSSPLKLLDQLKPDFRRSLCWYLYKWFRSHDKMAATLVHGKNY